VGIAAIAIRQMQSKKRSQKGREKLFTNYHSKNHPCRIIIGRFRRIRK